MKIILIDDEPDICVYLRTALEDQGHDVVTPEEDHSIVQVLQGRKPDLILLDIMMPKRSGISIYRELKTNPDSRDIAVFLMSGISPEKEFLPSRFRQLVKNPSIPLPEGFIEKPVQLESLIKMIKNLEK